MITYLDNNATTPIDPKVREVLLHYFDKEYGNEGSRTHVYGAAAKQAVQKARDQVANVVNAKREEVIFTSGATESNNLAILGLQKHAETTGNKHIITTSIEHKAVIEPMEEMEKRGFDVTYLSSDESGKITAEQVAQALRDDTVLVSVMHANNETGVIQPIAEITELLKDHKAYLHTDAAQTFGKVIEDLQNPRIDLISCSGHKLYSPKGVGALIARRRGYSKPPLTPITFGGGQERGLRPGTLPVALIAAFGESCELAIKNQEERAHAVQTQRNSALAAIKELEIIPSGCQDSVLPHVINFSIPGVDSEAMILALKDIVAISNGSACTSSSYTPSHVLIAMGYSQERAEECVRLSWSHLTPKVDWQAISERIRPLIP
jgi:cysteine desulfurase